jgi:arthrofactin-type cyclic lipopeptide synthetase C
MAVRLAAAMNRLGHAFTLQDLFSRPTISQLADHKEPEPFPGILTLHPGAGGVPIFFLHEGGGNVDYAFRLLPFLDPAVPVSAVTALGQESQNSGTFQDLAARMVQTVRKVQPCGPYRLIGWSLGGTLAYEMAQQLHRNGAEVGFVGMLDSHIGPRGRSDDDVQKALELDEKHLLMPFLKSLAAEAPEASRELCRLVALIEDLDFHEIVDRAHDLGLLPSTHTPAFMKDRMAYIKRLTTLTHAYSPEAHRFKVDYFAAGDEYDSLHGWEDILDVNNLIVHPVPGDHFTLLDAPNLEVTGAKIARAMAETFFPENMSRSRESSTV